MNDGTLGSVFTQITHYDGVSTTYTVTDTTEGIQSKLRYSFITVATNDLGDSLASSEARFTVTSLPQKPQSVWRSGISTRTQLAI